MRVLPSKTMIRVFIFTLILMSRLEAKETWIQAVGITTEVGKNHNNLGMFYAESANFLEACRKNKSRECKAYINPNLKYAKDADFLEKNDGKPESGLQIPSRISVLGAFEKAVLEAGPNDKILLALHNHGAPGSLKEGPSCIYLNQNEKICTADLEKILAKKPIGTKIAILCDGCFSGGCVNLSQPDVCTASTADQYREGMIQDWIHSSQNRQDVGVFSDVVKGTARNFSNLKSWTGSMGSETMIRHRCNSKFLKVFADFNKIDLNNFLGLASFLADAGLMVKYGKCDSGSFAERYRSLPDVVSALQKKSFNSIQERLCSDPNDDIDKEICEEWKKLEKDGQDAVKLYTELPRTLAWKTLFKQEVDKAFADIQNLSPEDAIVVHDLVIKMKDGRTSSAGAEKDKPFLNNLKAYAGALLAAYDRYVSMKKKAEALDDLVKKHFAASQLGPADFIRNCIYAPNLTPVSDLPPDSPLTYWRKKAYDFPRRNFTAQQIKQAKECETSFTLSSQ